MPLSKEQEAYSSAVAKAWSDDAFRARFINDPRTVLREEGWDIPDDVDVTVAANTSQSKIVIGLPAKPPGVSGESEMRRHAAKNPICC